MEELAVTSTLDMVTKTVKIFLAGSTIIFNSSERLIVDIISQIGTRKGRKPYAFKADTTEIVVVPNQIMSVAIEDIEK